MKIRPCISIVAFGLALFSTFHLQLSTGFAQTTTFAYSGQLTDSGTPANGAYDLRFSVFGALAGGSPVAGPLANAPVSVSNGLFTVLLDFGSNVFDGSDRWLEIGVRTNGSMDKYTVLDPRQPITSAPYAIRSLNAAQVTGAVSAGQIVGTLDSGNIADGSIGTSKLAANSVTAGAIAPGAVSTAQLADGAVTVAKVMTVAEIAVPASFVIVTNPTLVTGDGFGYAAAGVGTNGFVVGSRRNDTVAPNAGAAFLFDLSGALVMTFTNPAPADGDEFGRAVAAVGTDKILIGALFDDVGAANAGTAFLFDLNGILLATYTNPVPAAGDVFGIQVAAVGSDKVLIGANRDDTGATDAGSAYLFDLHGTLLTTFTNPSPAASELFGFGLASVGTNRVVIGASEALSNGLSVGAAYLFDLNGLLLTTFHNPSGMNDSFAEVVAGVGSSQVVITAPNASNGGAAYLFDLNGTLVRTFLNPNPAIHGFGVSAVAVGADMVLVGADGGASSGSAYLFRTDGTLLTTYTNPITEASDDFGGSVAWSGDKLIITDEFSNVGTADAGAAFVYSSARYAPGLLGDGARFGSITAEMLDATLGVWNKSGSNISYTAGKVGIGTAQPTTSLDVNGQIQATAFSGSGAGVSGLNANNISSGTLADARLSASVSLLGPTIESAEITDGTIVSGDIADGAIVNADLSASAAIADTKLATITTSGKVANSATTATSANTANAIVARNASGNFSVGALTANSFVIAPSTNAPTAGSTLTPSTGFVRLVPAAPVTLNATTAIADGSAVGSLLILMGVNVNTVTVPNNANTGLGASSRLLTPGATLTLIWNGTSWLEISYAAP